MHINRTTSRNERRGLTTTLGALIFISIVFTSVIPMLFIMKQADTIYEQEKLEIARLDEESAQELIDVYCYPTGDAAPNNLTIMIHNRC